MKSYQHITRAFKQAPWRLQTQAAAGGAVVLMVCLVLGGLFLAEASRTGTAGREVQALEARKAELARENAELRARLADLRSVYRMQARARELGFLPASPDQIEYLVVEGYYGSGPIVAAAELRTPSRISPQEPTALRPPIPDFTESLGEWLLQTLPVRGLFGTEAETVETSGGGQ